MKHTAGSWEVKHGSSGYGVYSGNIMVARMEGTVGEFNQEERNAQLIATSPELLHLAYCIISGLNEKQLREKARELIAKAEPS